MSRKIFAAAAAIIAAGTLVSSAAEACISCEYVPEVVRNHTTDNSGASSYAYHSRTYVSHEDRSSRSVKKRVAKSDDAPKSRKIAKTAKAEKVAKAERPAKVAVAKPVKSEPVKVAKSEPVAKPEPVTKQAETESSSITVASAEPVAKAAATAKASEPPAKATDCKKFFASVGMTLTVPCE